MKKLLPIFLIILITSCKKEDVNPGLIKEFSIQSTSTNANYKIKIALPDNYDSSIQKYATVYVLDGEENFNFVTNNCKEICSNYSTSNVLVVSIGYGNDRAIDYTPSNTGEGGGGAEKFMQFVKYELIPKIENDFGADTLRKNRTILGHSFGGLLAAYAFTNFNDVFGNYLMLSPSIWYDNEIMLRFEKENRNINMNNHQLVFMGLGGLENSGRMPAPYEAFHQRLQNNYPEIKITSHLQPHLDHMGSRNPNIVDGLTFYFENR